MRSMRGPKPSAVYHEQKDLNAYACRRMTHSMKAHPLYSFPTQENAPYGLHHSDAQRAWIPVFWF
jgi:hypothetical protein